MKEVDPGHEYLLDSYDGEQVNRLVFMKREGEGYPFNVGHHPGTNCQEVIRALIARVKYLQKQIPCDENYGLLTHLRGALFCLEYRAARRHGRILHIPSEQPLEVEDYSTCDGCGHIQCKGNHKVHASTPPDTPVVAREVPEALTRATALCRSGIAGKRSTKVELLFADLKDAQAVHQWLANLKYFAATTTSSSETPELNEILSNVRSVPIAAAGDEKMVPLFKSADGGLACVFCNEVFRPDTKGWFTISHSCTVGRSGKGEGK